MSVAIVLSRFVATSAASCAALVLVTASLPAGAVVAGGGGSADMPSSSAPQYDPAIEYRNGVAALEAQQWSDAEKAFHRVLSVAPRDGNSNYLMGLSKIGRSDYKGAKTYLEKAVRYAPDLFDAHTQLGIAQAKRGDAAKAGAELDWLNARAAACTAGCSDGPAIQAAIASLQAAMAEGKQASVTLPDLHLYASAQAGDGAYLAAVSLINEHRYADAIDSLVAAQRVFGPHPDVLTYLGFANRKLQRYDLAESYYRSALAVAPGHRGATEYFGEMMLERGDFAGAKRMLARLDAQCTFGCAEADELRRWVERRSSAS